MFDRRKHPFCANTALVLAFVLYLTAGAYADTGGVEVFEWKLIIFLVGIVQILVGYIYTSGIRSINTQLRDIHSQINHLEEHKLSKDEHRDICRK